ncbi:MAG: hypothetical protein ACI82Z_001245 [Cellvibrionaceae bacterium]|jgi:hypothetical protein
MIHLRRILLRSVLLLLIIVILSYLAVWWLSPLAIRSALEPYLAPQGLSLSSESKVRFNPFLTRVTISDLDVSKAQATTLAIEQVHLEIDLHKLWFDRQLFVRELTIEGGSIIVSNRPDGIIIAGYQGLTSNNSEQKSESSEPLVLPVNIVAPNMVLNNFVLHYWDERRQGDPLKRQITIKQLKIEQLDLSAETQTAQLSLALSLAEGSAAIDSRLSLNQFQGDLVSDIEFDNIQLESFMPYLGESLPLESVSGELAMALNAKLSFQSGISGNGQSAVAADLSRITPQTLQLTGKLALDKVQMLAEPDGALLAAWDTLRIEGIQANAELSNFADSINVELDEAIVTNITASKIQPSSAELPPLSTINRFALKTIQADSRRLSIDRIEVNGSYNHLLLAERAEGKGKRVENLLILATDDAKQSIANEGNSVDDSAELQESTELTFAINQIAFTGENVIQFLDKTVTPSYERTFYVDKLLLTNIDSQTKQPVDIQLVGRSNQYAKIDLSGYYELFSSEVNFGVKGSVEEVSLPSLSSYTRETLGFELKSGSLDAQLDVSVVKSELDGNSVLLIRGLETSASSTLDANKIQVQTPIPLNVSLKLLKDKQGNIRLEVPLSGSVNDPAFGLGSIVEIITRKVVAAQARRYLLRTFVPYADVISVAINATDMILRVRFEDLIYQPRQANIDQTQEAYLQQFIALMKDKPSTQVKICGVATLADLPRNVAKVPESVSGDIQENLRNLAQQRSDAFKAYAVERGAINSSRLLVCNPEIDLAADAKPRIELSI